jgi:uncharacterized protein
MIYAVLVVVGVITGITAGMFGFGGGFVIVPLVYHLFPAYDILSGANERWLLQIGVATSTAVMIVGTVYSSFKHHRAGNIDWSSVFPLAAYIGVGSAVGAYVATVIPGSVLHAVFILYILAVIADCVLRKGFVSDSDGHEFHAMGRGMEVLAGLAIGAVASLLGVGGSVMTVPLMRRHGARMKNAVAMANPLSFPVAIIGTATYVVAARHQGVDLGPDFLGFVHLPSFAILSLCSIAGVELAVRVLPKIPDRAHAITYVGLLILVVVIMLV